MVKPPPRADEEIAKAAMLDIAGNVTGRDLWKDYDERYVRQCILRAIREAKGAAAPAFFLIPFAVHAQNFTYKGVIVHQGTANKCIGPEVHAPPCLPEDVGYIDDQQRIHFTKKLSEAEQCELISRLSQR